jgi:hypothetical protein
MMRAFTQTSIPLDAQESILELADYLPASVRGSFVRNTVHRIEELAITYNNTLIYGAIGWVVGHVIDNFLSVHIPFTDGLTCLTGGKAGEAGLLAGVFKGFVEDRANARQTELVSRVVREEVRRAIMDAKNV